MVPERNWLVALLLSIFLGVWGIDRFYLGHIGTGIIKLFLALVAMYICWIWWLVDIYLIATRKLKPKGGRYALSHAESREYYRQRVEQWEAEGYDVSDFKNKWLK